MSHLHFEDMDFSKVSEVQEKVESHSKAIMNIED